MSTLSTTLALITPFVMHAPTALPTITERASGWLIASSDGYPWDSDTSKAGWALSIFGIVLLVVIVVVVLALVVRRRGRRG